MKTLTALILGLAMSTAVFSQDFLEGNFTFSKKEKSYLTLTDGSEVIGFIDDIDRKKGLIEKIVIKDSTGKKREFLPQQLHHMYIAPTKWDKFAGGMDKSYDITKWDDDKSVNMAHIKQGYALFEYAEVKIKDKQLSLLLQLVNPGYAEKIKVYFDPQASETASVGIGGFTVAGGIAKSYYVKNGDAVAFKLEKKHYKEKHPALYGECEALKKAFPKNMDWEDFSRHVFTHAKECNN